MFAQCDWTKRLINIHKCKYQSKEEVSKYKVQKLLKEIRNYNQNLFLCPPEQISENTNVVFWTAIF